MIVIALYLITLYQTDSFITFCGIFRKAVNFKKAFCSEQLI